MLKWVILIVGAVLLTWFVVKIIKVMLKAEKNSKKTTSQDNAPKQEEYEPDQMPIDIHSSTGGVPVTDMSNHNNSKADKDLVNELMDDFPMPSGGGFMDSIDDDFDDFSNFAHNSKGRRRKPVDFDLDGDLADEYIPDSPDFSYLHPRRQPKQSKTIEKSLNELPTELKVLMLSNIFDRRF